MAVVHVLIRRGEEKVASDYRLCGSLGARFTVRHLFGLIGTMSFLLATIGGALGGVCRYLFSSGLSACCPAGFPWATLLVNALGSFLLGLSLGVGLSGAVGDAAARDVGGQLLSCRP